MLTPLFDHSLDFNQFWWDLGVSTGRTSLITDPTAGLLDRQVPITSSSDNNHVRILQHQAGLPFRFGPGDAGFESSPSDAA